jgi:hypothetical protein
MIPAFSKTNSVVAIAAVQMRLLRLHLPSSAAKRCSRISFVGYLTRVDEPWFRKLNKFDACSELLKT